jgi:hypothetical protein
MNNKDIDVLFDILSHKRPYGTKTDEDVIKKYLDVIPKMQSDAFGNRILRVGSHPTVMFSCHTDTVHRTEGIQKICVDETRQEVFLANDKSNCLGADDGAGMWLMLQLIKAGKRGLYVFHRGEEVGGLGSDFIAQETPELLDGIKYCIAFDRKGEGDVVTHQAYGRCCSDTFGDVLAAALGGKYKIDPTGVFTDSANYTHIIPECTNISVGYYSEHKATELLDYGFLVELSDKLRRITFETLPVERDPEVDEVGGYYGQWPSAIDYSDWEEDNPWDKDAATFSSSTFDADYDKDYDAIYSFVCHHPIDVTELLLRSGYTTEMLRQEAG